MRYSFRGLLVLASAWCCLALFGSGFSVDGRAWAQDSGRSSSRPDGSDNRDDRRSNWRGRFGDRGSRDWRGGRSRDDSRGSDSRGSDDRSRNSSSSSSSTNSSSSSSSTRSNSSSSTSSTPSTTSSSSSSSGPAIDVRAWATKLVREHDKNGDMILEPDEQGFLGSEAAKEDLNHDGKITIDELVMYRSGGAALANPAASSATPSSASSSTSSSDNRERFGRHDRHNGDSTTSSSSAGTSLNADVSKRVLTGSVSGGSTSGKDADKRHTYRFSKASDHLPSGLPSWFKSKDTNGDGQISMSEFSRSWSESTVEQFRRYDLNNDGIITAKEAAKAK